MALSFGSYLGFLTYGRGQLQKSTLKRLKEYKIATSLAFIQCIQIQPC